MPASNRRKNIARLQLVTLERRDVPSGYRSIDGTGNNVANITWGSAGVNLLRRAPTTYADGFSAPSAGRPNPRDISNKVVDQGSESVINERGLAAMAYAWGQFIDHDMSLTKAAAPLQLFNIIVPPGDQHFPAGSTITLRRSAFDPATGTTNPRQQKNSITAFIDGSQIYGSDAIVAAKLRTFAGGRLKTSAGNMLPLNNQATFPTGVLTLDNQPRIVSDDQLFAAGDIRVNENIELTSLHTLFMREHNRMADSLKKFNPGWDDEKLYQSARAWVIAELQAITYNQWLPTVLGSAWKSIDSNYYGYKANMNPGIANEFSTAGYRVGHTMLGDDVEFLDNNGLPIADEVELSQAFFNPPMLVANGGIDPVLKYLATDPASEIDNTVINSVRNFLFGAPGAGGMDLASLNIQRGRDHGLADYNSARVAYGLPAVTSFAQMTSDPVVQQRLRLAYGTTGNKDNVNNVDLWVGMLAEDHIPGSNTGPLVARILIDQFKRLRDGDRFWYERTFPVSSVQQLRRTTLTDVLRRNTGLTNLQDNVFTFQASISGTVYSDVNLNGRREPNEPGIAGRTLELWDVVSNDVVGTKVSKSNGSYSFSVVDGLGAGRYQVREVLPTGMRLTTSPPAEMAITRGDISIKRVNIGNAAMSALPLVPPPPPCATNSPSAGAGNPWVDYEEEFMGIC